MRKNVLLVPEHTGTTRSDTWCAKADSWAYLGGSLFTYPVDL
jgi:hypothetical protein